jgi:hypothetical protein
VLVKIFSENKKNVCAYHMCFIASALNPAGKLNSFMRRIFKTIQKLTNSKRNKVVHVVNQVLPHVRSRHVQIWQSNEFTVSDGNSVAPVDIAAGIEVGVDIWNGGEVSVRTDDSASYSRTCCCTHMIQQKVDVNSNTHGIAAATHVSEGRFVSRARYELVAHCR